MGDAIKRCQFLGVPVSLSIGGFGAAYSLPTNLSALALFDHLWNTYFGGNLTDPRRPFGDAWLDGVDMFLEHATPAEHYNTLALELAKHNIRAGDGKLLHLTATPHCRSPTRASRRPSTPASSSASTSGSTETPTAPPGSAPRSGESGRPRTRSPSSTSA
ncbi:hypothetical protein BS78_K025600 [Paspalum vaginatum]|uniref:GH18 domain-containing protein n=1 Tax=Paspalum vaginatum TaxID=158149 RepID=A0A9W7X7A6_9POAL|nr:hypothetical protein BS78_K025600 [Paspalum vaginatum]